LAVNQQKSGSLPHILPLFAMPSRKKMHGKARKAK